MNQSDRILDPNDPLDRAWLEISECFGIGGRNGTSSVKSPNKDMEITPETLAILKETKILAEKTCHFIQAHFNGLLRNEIVPRFWRHYSSLTEDENENQFVLSVHELYMNVSELAFFVQKLENLSKDLDCECNLFGQTSYPDLYKLMLKSTLHSQLPSNFETIVRLFYSQAFHVFYTRQERNNSIDCDDSNAGEEVECSGCKMETEVCECNAILSRFHEINGKLLELDILERIASSVITEIVNSRIENHVQETCKGSFTISHLKTLVDWLDAVVMAWIRMIFTANVATPVHMEKTSSSLNRFRKRLINHLYETYTKTRIDQLFNIIIEFPDSHPALEDLRECLNETDLRPFLTKQLKSVLIKKLLHLGVNTTDILTAYIASIRALRVLDSSGVILEIVCEPVRKYLRTRDDTVRCIVQSLIDENNSELADELKQNEGLFLDESFYEEEDMDDWEQWMPDPMDADKNRKGQGRRISDIISMLVNIYGSKELFVNEYRSLLSNRLLSQLNYETEKEIRNLELLKLRFGDAPLHQCEVMLKDISDSKRINALLHNSEKKEGLTLKDQPFPVNAFILSAQFWPQFKEESLKLPQEVTKSLEIYTKSFEDTKGNRTLVWQSHLGFANIDLEIGGKKINLTVSPIHAAIIYQFQVKAEWTGFELAKTLDVSIATLRKRIAFWQTQGLIREVVTDKYKLIEEGPMRRLSGIGPSEMAGIMEDEESESVTRTSRDQRADELQVFWSYIVNMLINLESLPLERIFQMLKMFATQGTAVAVDCELDEVRQFLDKKVREHELVYVGGNYKLPAKNT